jgi:hypothetical protein
LPSNDLALVDAQSAFGRPIRAGEPAGLVAIADPAQACVRLEHSQQLPRERLAVVYGQAVARELRQRLDQRGCALDERLRLRHGMAANLAKQRIGQGRAGGLSAAMRKPDDHRASQEHQQANTRDEFRLVAQLAATRARWRRGRVDRHHGRRWFR